jgi:hypothetical protein
MRWHQGRVLTFGATLLVCAAVLLAGAAHAQQDTTAPPPSDAATAPPSGASSEADLAKSLSNPVAALISVPFQANLDGGIGPSNGSKFTLNIQPVVPIPLGADWNMISRTIVPVVGQSDIAPGSGSQFGLSDTLQSLFFSPSKVGKLIWGVGPAILVPTATDRLLGAGKWSAGPTVVVLSQSNGWTIGALANQLWSFAGGSNRAPYNKLFVQPFLNYTTKTATTVGLSAEGTYDWRASGLSLPLIGTVSQVTKVGGQLISVSAAIKYYVATAPNGPHGVGARFALTLLFPRR